MIYTSYFANMQKIPKGIIPISIALYSPYWYKGLCYTKLAPNKHILEWWKNSEGKISENARQLEYRNMYCNAILSNLKFNEIIKDVTSLAEFINDDWCTEKDPSVVFLCFEKKDKFCHRHIVADYFTVNGILVEEL